MKKKILLEPFSAGAHCSKLNQDSDICRTPRAEKNTWKMELFAQRSHSTFRLETRRRWQVSQGESVYQSIERNKSATKEDKFHWIFFPVMCCDARKASSHHTRLLLLTRVRRRFAVLRKLRVVINIWREDCGWSYDGRGREKEHDVCACYFYRSGVCSVNFTQIDCVHNTNSKRGSPPAAQTMAWLAMLTEYRCWQIITTPIARTSELCWRFDSNKWPWLKGANWWGCYRTTSDNRVCLFVWNQK